jgi:hypothetical protein
MRTEIEKQQIKRIIVYFSCYEREKNKKQKQSITGGNSTIISLHASYHVEKNTIVHPGRQRMARFSHRVVSHVPPE